MLLISELKSNDYLKVDGRKVDVLLLSLRNAYHLHHDFPSLSQERLFLCLEKGTKTAPQGKSYRGVICKADEAGQL